jgi:hypothetical protein
MRPPPTHLHHLCLHLQAQLLLLLRCPGPHCAAAAGLQQLLPLQGSSLLLLLGQQTLGWCPLLVPHQQPLV